MAESCPAQEITVHPPLVENVFAPEIFISEASFFSITSSNATITFTSHRWDNGTQPPLLKRIVVGRVVMPIAAAQALAVSLYDYLAKAGHDPAQRPTDPTQVQ
jgi:hypothetical protein